MRLLTALALLCLLVPAPATAEKLPIKSQQFTLENGLRVIHVPHHRLPIVAHMVWYQIGAVDESLELSGISHFLEHLMFKQTKQLAPGDFSEHIASLGGNNNAFTAYDYTAYYQVIPKEGLEKVMELEAERMRNLVLNASAIEVERKVILEERRSRTDNVPRSLLIEQMRASLFPDHPYGTPVIGSQENIHAITQDALRTFYDNYYHPANAIVVIAGDVEHQTVKALAERYYGTIEASASIAKKRAPITTAAKPPVPLISLSDPKITQPEWLRFYRVPSANTAPEGQYTYALSLLAQLLGGSESSRLYKELAINKDIATETSTYYDDTTLDESVFSIYILPSKGTPLHAIEPAFTQALERIAEEGVSEEELTRTKNKIKANVLYALDNVKNTALIYGTAAATNLGPDYVEDWLHNMMQVSSDDIKRAAHCVLDSQHVVTGQLLPGK